MKNKIFLVGMPASGKSSLLRKISRFSSLPVIDTDRLVERAYRQKISETFRKYGEKTFRKRERKVLLKLLARPEPCIVATGGGLPVYRQQWKLLKKYGTVVFLVTPMKLLEKRLARPQNRPMFQAKNQFKACLQKLRRKRLKYYRKADVSGSFSSLLPYLKSF